MEKIWLPALVPGRKPSSNRRGKRKTGRDRSGDLVWWTIKISVNKFVCSFCFF